MTQRKSRARLEKTADSDLLRDDWPEPPDQEGGAVGALDGKPVRRARRKQPGDALAKGRIDFENVHYRDGNHPRPQLGCCLQASRKGDSLGG